MQGIFSWILDFIKRKILALVLHILANRIFLTLSECIWKDHLVAHHFKKC